MFSYIGLQRHESSSAMSAEDFELVLFRQFRDPVVSSETRMVLAAEGLDLF